MQHADPFDWESFRRVPIVGILRGYPGPTVRRIAGAFAAAGFYPLEVTMNTPDATDTIAALRDAFPTLLVGAGTVRDTDELAQALSAGAQFIVTPVLVPEVISGAIARGVPIFPGAYTPTEIYRAWTLGASAVKVFPAAQLGPRYVREVLAPLDGVRLLPTGGVAPDNIHAYLAAGAVGVGMGSGLFPRRFIDAGDYAGLQRHLAGVRSAIAE